MRLPPIRAAPILIVAVVLAGCGGGGGGGLDPTPTATTTTPAAGGKTGTAVRSPAWPTYGGSASRAGVAAGAPPRQVAPALRRAVDGEVHAHR